MGIINSIHRGILPLQPDGTLYVADSSNHRILHLDQEGNLLHVWGEYGASDYDNNIEAPAGTFNEPWGIAVGPDGSVYVTDTWNNRIQKFTAEGEFITMWGEFGAAKTDFDFWGPRGLAVDDEGRVYVTDTGNKRVVIFDSDGNSLESFGGAGMGVGQFDEPVGIAVDDLGRIYIADTWNMRIQIMIPNGDSLSYTTNITWDIEAWYGDSLENKPFLAVDDQYQVYVADPTTGRVLIFDDQGSYLGAFEGYGSETVELGIVGGLAIDLDGQAWVSDATNNRLMRFPVEDLLASDPAAVDEEIIFEENEVEDGNFGAEEDSITE